MRILVSKRAVFSLAVVAGATAVTVINRRTIDNLRREKAKSEQLLNLFRRLLPPEIFEEDDFELAEKTLRHPALLRRLVYGISFNRAITLGHRTMALTKVVEATSKQLGALSASGDVSYVTLFLAHSIINVYVRELQSLMDAYEAAMLKLEVAAKELK